MFNVKHQSIIFYGLLVEDFELSQCLINSSNFKELEENSKKDELFYFQNKEVSLFGFVLLNNFSLDKMCEIPEHDVSMLSKLCIELNKFNIEFKYLDLKSYLVDISYME